VAYNVGRGGRVRLPPQTVWENERVLPRAFVVPRARPLSPRAEVLQTLKAADFRAVVFLEGYDGDPGGSGSFRAAEVINYRPNRVEVKVGAGEKGFLVLTDVWYPGWKCTVDGEEVPVYRADYVFRAVPVGPGEHEVVFCFEPDSYRVGRLVTRIALAVLPALVLVLAVWGRCRRRQP
jgi:uncharacterized membrane protein YfhO